MSTRRGGRLARQLGPVIGLRHMAAVAIADQLLAATHDAVGAIADQPGCRSALVTMVADQAGGWRLMILRGHTGDVAWLVDDDPNLRSPSTGPTLVGSPIPHPDPAHLLASVLLINGAHLTVGELPAIAGLRHCGVAYRADIPTGHGGFGWALTDADPADLVLDATRVVRAIQAHLPEPITPADDDETRDQLATTLAELACSDPDTFAMLAAACWQEADNDPDPSDLGLPYRFGWSIPDLCGGLSFNIPWPSIILDSLLAPQPSIHSPESPPS